MQDLKTDTHVSRPVGEIILVSHAAENGWMEMALTDAHRDETQYEYFDQVKAEAEAAGGKNPLAIPDEILKTAGGSVQKAKVRVKGCRIGIAKPFVARLKEALEQVEQITTDKHMHSGYLWIGATGTVEGYIEYLSYCFESFSLSRIKTKTGVINLFKADKHEYFDGTKVPDNQWEKWLGKDGAKVESGITQGKKHGAFSVTLPTAWGASIRKAGINDGIEFEYVMPSGNGFWDVGKPQEDDASQEQIRAFLKDRFTAPVTDPKKAAPWAKFFETHPWPIWKRFPKVRYEPFDSLDGFLSGFVWTYTEGFGWSGHRHRYRLVVPITNPVTTNNLLGNYFPVAKVAAHVDLDEKDGPLFCVL